MDLVLAEGPLSGRHVKDISAQQSLSVLKRGANYKSVNPYSAKITDMIKEQ